MLKKVYISKVNCVTPLGFDLRTNMHNILEGKSGILKQTDKKILQDSFYASIIDEDKLNDAFRKVTAESMFTKLEKMMILALYPIIDMSKLTEKTVFLLSTTKGNIESISSNIEEAQLNTLAKKVALFFNIKTEPIVVSNACVSGVLAVSVAKRLIQSEQYDNAIIVAGDLVSQFVLSGFNSFQAMSHEPCKPYSKNRAGVSLGEAAAGVVVTSSKDEAIVEILGDGSINDANHISGPSRTGEGLVRSIESALLEAKINVSDLDYISAHGTATPFNDEMEAIAFNRLEMGNVPVNSLKGYYGHTLGASGLLETVIGIESMQKNMLVPSLGFDELGVTKPINIIKEIEKKELNCFLKTASGFGGCNTAVIFQKME